MIIPRQLTQQLIQAALQAVDPELAVKRYFAEHPEQFATLQQCAGRVWVVGAGKASAPMAKAMHELLGDKIHGGLIIVKYGHSLALDSPIKIVEAGHPVPDEAGYQATQDLIALLEKTTSTDLVVTLISGGGSALLTMPAIGLTLSELQTTNQLLLAAGATINQINTVRKHLSAIKGGRLAQWAAPSQVLTLILSDVVGDPLDVIASGPTVPDPTTFAEAWAIVQQFELMDKLPPAVGQHLQAGVAGQVAETPKPGDSLFEQVHNVIIGSNILAAQAAVEAAHTRGWSAQLLTTFMEGEAREVGRMVAALAKGLAQTRRPSVWVLGGETTVTLRMAGRGGRNQEMALAAAIALAGWSRVFVTCLGTDGTDGPTDAAGAWVDGSTVEKAKALGLDAVAYLNRHEAYNFFKALDDLIMTGPTKTNVNDLVFIMAW